MYYMNMENEIVVGSSPESFVAVHNGEVTTNPIAGTIRRGTTREMMNAMQHQLITRRKK